jgi:MFS family permease
VAENSLTKTMRRRVRIAPFTAYLVVVAGWFFSFGLQTTLFPGVINYTLNESPERLGLAQAAVTAPMLFLLPLAGVLAERWDRRTVISSFHILASISSAVMAWLLLNELLHYKSLLVYALVVGTAGAFVMPARDSAVNPVTRVSQRMGHPGFTLQKAVILTSLVQFAAQVLGMGAGFLAGLYGPGPLFVAQASVLIIGGTAALFLPRLHSRQPSTDTVIESLKGGVKAVFGSPILAPMTLIMMAVGCLIVGGGFFVIIPVLVRDEYMGGYGLLSSLMVSFWVGAFVANVILAQVRSIERPGRVLMGAQLVTVVTMGVLALPISVVWLYALVFAWGLGGGVAITLSRSVVQENAPSDKVARVMSVYQLGLFGGMPIGALVMGYVVAELGPRTAALIPMVGLLAVLIVIAVFTPILKVRRVDPA